MLRKNMNLINVKLIIATSMQARIHFKVDKSSWVIFKQMNKKRT